MSETNNIVSFKFDANVTIQQTVSITNPNYTAEKVTEGLNKGTIFTTIGYDREGFGDQYLYGHESNKEGGIDEVIIGRIIAQDACSECCEYEGFRVVLED